MEEYEFGTRLVSPEMNQGESEEISLRPKTLDEYVGQEKVKENLRIYLTAAQRRGEQRRADILRDTARECRQLAAVADTRMAAAANMIVRRVVES